MQERHFPGDGSVVLIDHDTPGREPLVVWCLRDVLLGVEMTQQARDDANAQYAAACLAYFGPEPPAPVPARVSARQAWLEMASRPSKMGKASMLDDFKAIAAGAGPLAQIEFDKADFYERASLTLNQLAAAYGLSEADVDDLFRASILR